MDGIAPKTTEFGHTQYWESPESILLTEIQNREKSQKWKDRYYSQMWVQVPARSFTSTVALLNSLTFVSLSFLFPIWVNNTCSVIRLTGDNGEWV